MSKLKILICILDVDYETCRAYTPAAKFNNRDALFRYSLVLTCVFSKDVN